MFRLANVEEPHIDQEGVLHFFMCSLYHLDPFGEANYSSTAPWGNVEYAYMKHDLADWVLDDGRLIRLGAGTNHPKFGFNYPINVMLKLIL